jgi:hypothetical protein
MPKFVDKRNARLCHIQLWGLSLDGDATIFREDQNLSRATFMPYIGCKYGLHMSNLLHVFVKSFPLETITSHPAMSLEGAQCLVIIKT